MFSKSLYKLDSKFKSRIWTIEVEGNAYRTISGLIDGEKVTSEWSYAYGKNTGRANATTDEEQAMKIAETLIRIRKEQGCVEDLSQVNDGVQYFQPMLANKWYGMKEKDRNKFFSGRVFVQPKLDGIRCIIKADGMWSRHGKPIISAPHIFEEIKPLFEKYPDLILDGELYSHDLNNDFNYIISLVRKSKPTKEDLAESAKFIQFWNYDYPSCPGTFAERTEALKKFHEMELKNLTHPEYFVFVQTEELIAESEVETWLGHFLEKEYEGAILRSDGEYECRRSKNLLKVKKFIDEEFKIKDIEEGRGNLSGKAGRIICEIEGKSFSAGLKFNHDDAAEIWQNKGNYIGKSATIRYFQLTPDGLPRFPKCTAIAREDWE